MSVVDRSPTTPGRVIALLAATIAFLTTLAGTAGSVGIGLVGAGLLALGVFAGSRPAIDLGALALFAGVVFAAAWSTSPVLPLVGAVAAVVAWDAAENGLSLGQQLGRDAATGRAEAVHAAVTLGVGLVAAIGAYAVYRLSAGNQPLPALVLLLFAAVVLTAALRD